MIDPTWEPTEIDPDFTDSIWQRLGYSNLLCPTCRAHIRNGICLNACHLTARSRQNFNMLMASASKRVEERQEE